MTIENIPGVESRTRTPEGKLFLALCCSQKQLAAKPVESDEQNLTLQWHGNRVVGAAAICLYLEASIPDPGLFPNGNIGMPVALLHWWQSMKQIPTENQAALLANGTLISRQMQDGRPFLQGPSAGLADICAASWCIPHRRLFPADTILLPWIDRMQAIATSEPIHPASRLAAPEDIGNNAQYQGLLEFTVEDNIAIITSPLDDGFDCN